LPKAAPPRKGWLDALVAAELERHDPVAALAGLPPDVRGAGASSADLAPAAASLVARSLRARKLDAPDEVTAAFLEEVRQHVVLLLDLAVLRGAPSDPPRRRAEIATFLAAALGDEVAAAEVLPVAALVPERRLVERALHSAEHELVERFHPPGDPVLGLPLHAGAIAILRRRLSRVAMGFHREGVLHPYALASHARYAERESVLLVEALAGILAAAGTHDARAPAVRARQVASLGLSRGAAREARAALVKPRSPGDLARAAPAAVRPFLLEQLFLAVLKAGLDDEGASGVLEAFVAAAALSPEAIVAARVEAAAQHGDRQLWFDAFDQGGIDWQALAGEWGAATDAVVERLSATVTDNLGAVVKELRETGELGQLLARAAAGNTLTAEERKKVRAQLIDLAKAVPALAIFAAPGGMLLLPLLAKLLPFDVLPSAWARARPAPAATKGARDERKPGASAADGARARARGEPPEPSGE
jgi:hypothetical protein